MSSVPPASHSPPDAPSDAPTHLWEDLARRLEEFLAAWERVAPETKPPEIGSHLPTEPPPLRRLVLVELTKADMEQRGKRGWLMRLEEYAAQFPELIEAATGEPSVDLIFEEYHVRQSLGEKVSIKEYGQRFPKSAEALKKLMGAEGISASSALFPARRIDDVHAGERLDDFELLNELGKGAFASVFLARQVSMQRLVALKVSAEKGNEPQTLAQLDHPNIVRVYDQRRIPERRMRLLYMQYAPGGTLADVITCVRRTPSSMRTGAVLPLAADGALNKAGQAVTEDAPWRRRVAAYSWPEMACRIGIQLAQALDYAHKMKVLHRDVKPANVLLTAEGSPKLADFNISFGSHVVGATPAAYFGGSLAYMSPEQLEACSPLHSRRPEELDNRADLYSLAVLLWELLHGDRPFPDVALDEGWNETVEEMIWQRKQEKITITALAAPPDAVSRRMERVLRKGLAADPGARYQTGAEMARELTLCLHGRSWELFHDFGKSWRAIARSQPLAAIIPINLLPNLLAAGYNWYFNYVTFILPSEDAAIKEAFWIVWQVANGIAFPLGVIFGCAFAWPVVRAVWRVTRGVPSSPQELASARWRSLLLGHVIAAIGVSLWVVAGIAFPMALHFLAGHFSTKGYIHFFVSLTVCGLIAAAFPYLGTTWLAVRVFYPALLGSGAPEAREQRLLEATPQHASIYLALAAVVPMIAILLIIIGASTDRVAAAILTIASLLGFLIAYFAYHRIRSDVDALTIATKAADTFGVGTETEKVG